MAQTPSAVMSYSSVSGNCWSGTSSYNLVLTFLLSTDRSIGSLWRNFPDMIFLGGWARNWSPLPTKVFVGWSGPAGWVAIPQNGVRVKMWPLDTRKSSRSGATALMTQENATGMPERGRVRWTDGVVSHLWSECSFKIQCKKLICTIGFSPMFMELLLYSTRFVFRRWCSTLQDTIQIMGSL